MKSTGIVRKVDELGRFVIPKELRRTLNIDIGDSLEIYVDGANIILRKYQPGCVLCGAIGNAITVGDKLVCADCARRIAAIARGDA